MKLFGREELLQQVADSTAPLFLLAGDSGTGKTSALTEVQAQSGTTLAPEPVQVSRAPGSLQLALLESMGAALALIAADTTKAQAVGQRIVDAATRVADLRVRDLRAAVGRHLISVVRSRAGDEMAELLQNFGTALSESANESLAARITAGSDQDVVDQIVSFAGEIVAMAGERKVHLALDDLDRLDDDDLRRLADLVDRLPPGMQVRGSFATWHTSSRASLDLLVISGAATVTVSGLHSTEVEAWLSSSGLDPTLASDVMSATNGYPLQVADAIALLGDPTSASTLERMSPDDVLKARTRHAWRELDLMSQIAAAKLCVYTDPIGAERVNGLLGVDAVAWGALEHALVEAGLLLDDRRRWFHELRRRVIWDDLLTPEMRASALDAATAELRDQLSLPGQVPSDYITFARVARENLSFQAAEASVIPALEADQAEIAVAAAVLELIEFSRGEQAIGSEVVLAHARSVYKLEGDPIEALDRLSSRGLVYVASNEQASIVAPTWGSVDAINVIVGRAASELARIPIVQLASEIFEESVRPHLVKFQSATYGIGSPSFADSCEIIARMHREPRDGVVHLGRQGPGLVFSGSNGEVPFYANISFDEEADRDEALARLSEANWDDRAFLALHLLAVPGVAAPSLRFARAIDWLVGREKFSLHMLRPLDSQAELGLVDELTQRQQFISVIRDRCSSAELLAYDLEGPVGYAYIDAEDAKTVVEVEGFGGVVPINERWGAELGRPFSRLRLAEELGLTPEQSIGTIHWRHGRYGKDPITDEVVRLQKEAARSNRSQRKVEVRFEQAELEGALRSAFDLMELDGLALLSSLPDAGLSEPPPKTTYMLLELDEPAAGWISGAHALITTVERPREADGVAVNLRIVRAPDRPPGDRVPGAQLIGEAFGLSDEGQLGYPSSEAIGGISRMLGYSRDEVRFRYSNE